MPALCVCCFICVQTHNLHPLLGLRSCFCESPQNSTTTPYNSESCKARNYLQERRRTVWWSVQKVHTVDLGHPPPYSNPFPPVPMTFTLTFLEGRCGEGSSHSPGWVGGERGRGWGEEGERGEQYKTYPLTPSASEGI